MRVWVLKDGETLPIHAGVQKMRTGMLGEALVARGHEVTWWASTFSHQRKRLVADRDIDHEVGPRFRLKLLHAGSYARNVSLRRYLHHRRLGRQFRETARRVAAPDVIVSAFPVIDLAYEAVRFGVEHAVPVVVDARDLWPTTFLDEVPRALRGVARLALDRDFRRARHVFVTADSLVAMSHGVLKWAQSVAARRPSASDRVFYIGHVGSRHTANRPPDPPRYLAGPGDRLVVAYIGAFGGSYELRTVCDVARRLSEAGDDRVLFVLAGDGDQRRSIARCASGLPNVVLPGWLGSADAERLLAHAHVGLIPWNSIPDAMPNKLFEYLAAGLPIISSAEGELATLIEESRMGYAYRAGDADHLLVILRTLAGNRERLRNMTAAAQRVFTDRFRAEGIYEQYAAHVEAVVTGRCRRDR